MKSARKTKSRRAKKPAKKSVRETGGIYAAEETAAEKSLISRVVTKLNGGFNDTAFADNKSRPIHRWIPWIAI